MDVVALRAREKTIKPKEDEINSAVREGKLTRQAADESRQKLYAETFTPRELVILNDSVSNAEFHYLGSAKIMAQIGKGFAEEMATMLGERK
jgi:alpha-galactosidase